MKGMGGSGSGSWCRGITVAGAQPSPVGTTVPGGDPLTRSRALSSEAPCAPPLGAGATAPAPPPRLRPPSLVATEVGDPTTTLHGGVEEASTESDTSPRGSVILDTSRPSNVGTQR